MNAVMKCEIDNILQMTIQKLSCFLNVLCSVLHKPVSEVSEKMKSNKKIHLILCI